MPTNRTLQIRDQRVEDFRGLSAPRSVNALRRENRPVANIITRIQVCILLMAALSAVEVQALSVGCRDVTTPGTPPAGVSGIDQLESNTHSSRLILDKELPSGIRPSVDFGSEVFSFLERTVSDVAQVFADDSLCPGLNRVSYQLFTRYVKQVIRYGCLVPRHPAKQASGGLGANGLDSGAGAPDARTTVIKPTAFEEKCFTGIRVGCGHQPFDSEIHSDYPTGGTGFRYLNLVTEYEVPLFTDSTDLGILPPGVRDSGANQFDRLTEDSHTLFVPQEIPAVCHGYGRFSVDSQFPSFVGLGGLIGSGYLTEERAGQLRRKLKLFTDNPVELVMQLSGVQLLGLEHDWRDPVQCGKIPEAQGVVMPRIPGEFDLDCTDCFQYKLIFIIFQNMSTTIVKTNTCEIPPTAKAVGFLAHLS